MTNWKTYKLGEIITLKRGYDLPEDKRIKGSIPIFSSAGLSGYHNEARSKGPGVITGRYGTLGEVFYSEEDFWPHNTTLYVKDFKGNHPKFICYFLQTLGFNNQNDKTSVPGLNRNHLHDLFVSIPEKLDTQKKIAKILSSFDDKIELNRRTNHTLEQMAQALFKKYFVDGIDKENLPDGWRWEKLECVIMIKHGYAFQGEFFSEEETDKILLSPGNFRIGGGFNYNKFKYYKGEVQKEYVLSKNDLIVTMTDLSKNGDTLGYSAITPEIEYKNLLHNQRIGKVLFKENDNIKYYLYLLMRTDDYHNFIVGGATGTTVKHTSPSRICEYQFIIPDEKTIIEFNEAVLPLIELEMQNQKNSSLLNNLRDTLLPKLMNGEFALN